MKYSLLQNTLRQRELIYQARKVVQDFLYTSYVHIRPYWFIVCNPHAHKMLLYLLQQAISQIVYGELLYPSDILCSPQQLVRIAPSHNTNYYNHRNHVSNE